MKQFDAKCADLVVIFKSEVEKLNGEEARDVVETVRNNLCTRLVSMMNIYDAKFNIQTVNEPAAICKKFNETVHVLISKLESKTKTQLDRANIEKLKRRINLIKQTLGPQTLIVECSPFMFEYRDHILVDNPDDFGNFFLKMDVRVEFLNRKGLITPDDEFVFSLIDVIKSQYTALKPAEKNGIYSDVKSLLDCCTDYALTV